MNALDLVKSFYGIRHEIISTAFESSSELLQRGTCIAGAQELSGKSLKWSVLLPEWGQATAKPGCWVSTVPRLRATFCQVFGTSPV